MVDLNKIEEKKKTTLMIKNIPNKYSKQLLLEEIDSKFAGKYDFFYLPMDC
jgi:protein phosphatase 1 regulatory subunit 42